MISIKICLRDQEYACCLGERLAGLAKELDVEVISGIADISGYGSERISEAGCDYILADEQTWVPLTYITNRGLILVLAESRVVEPQPSLAENAGGAAEDAAKDRRNAAAALQQIPDNVRFIDGFQRANELLSFIRRDYSLKGDCKRLWGSEGEQRTEFICCLGLAGGNGTSSLAIGIGRELAAYRDKRTIYISLEAVEADGLCIDDKYGLAETVSAQAALGANGRKCECLMPDRHNIGDFLYLVLKDRVKNIELFLDSQLYRDNYGLQRFRPSHGINDLRQLSETELDGFIKIICGSGQFDYIVFDLGSDPGDHIDWLAETETGLVLVGNGSEAKGCKEEKMLDVLRARWNFKDRKTVLVRNMVSVFGEAWQMETVGDSMDDGAIRGGKSKLKVNFSFPKVLGLSAKIADDAENMESAISDEERLGEIEVGFDRDGFRVTERGVDFVLSNEFGHGVKKIVDRLMLAEVN